MRTRDDERTAPGSARAPESITARTSRVDDKIARATVALQTLSPTASTARLLASAILRRDEVLLDAVLAEALREQAAVAVTRRK